MTQTCWLPRASSSALISELLPRFWPEFNLVFATIFMIVAQATGNADTHRLDVHGCELLPRGRAHAASRCAFCRAFPGVGDPLAGLVGQRFGGYRISGKSLEASSGFVLGALAISALFVALGVWLPVRGVIVGAEVATVLEVTPIGIEDDLTIPLGSGVAMIVVESLISRSQVQRFWSETEGDIMILTASVPLGV